VGGDYFPIMMTAGFGDHVRSNGTRAGAIFGIGVGLSPAIGVSVSSNTDYVNIGTSVKLDALKNFAFSATLVDAFDAKGKRQGQFAISYSMQDVFGGHQ
jgi:hypothetical protein